MLVPYLLAPKSSRALVACFSFLRSTAKAGSLKVPLLLWSISQSRTHASLVTVTKPLPEGESGCHTALTMGDCSRTWAVGPTWNDRSFSGCESGKFKCSRGGRRHTWHVCDVNTAIKSPDGETESCCTGRAAGILKTCIHVIRSDSQSISLHD